MLDRRFLALCCLVMACGGRTATDLPGSGASAGLPGVGGTAGNAASSGTSGVVVVGGSSGAAAYPSTGGIAGGGYGGYPGYGGYFPGGAGGIAGGGYPGYGGIAGGGYPGYGGYFPGGTGGGTAGTGGKVGAGCYVDGAFYAIGEPISPCCYCAGYNSIACYEPCTGVGGMAGSAGTGGGSSMCPSLPPELGSAMIDDFEDGDYVPYHPLGYGAWYPYSDETGFQSMGLTSLSFNGSAYALNVNGYGNLEWGAGMGVSLHGLAPECPADWRWHHGVAFAASANRIAVRVNVVTMATQGFENGGACITGCYDHYGWTISVGPNESFLLSFDTLAQEGWGAPTRLDLSRVVGLQFQMRTGTAYNLSVDDVYLSSFLLQP